MMDRLEQLNRELYETEKMIEKINSDRTLSIKECSDRVNINLIKIFRIEREIYEIEQAERKAAKEEERRQENEEKRKKEQAEKERVSEITACDLPLDWENAFADDESCKGVYAENIPDGLILSLTNLGKVDIEYISTVTGEDMKTVISALKGSIFQNPEKWDECFYKGFETTEEYLSGNLRRKLKIAREANKKYSGFFSENIKALKRFMPKSAAAEEIYVTLGSPFIPVDIIDAFVNERLGISKKIYKGTLHDETTGSWELPQKNDYYFKHSFDATHTYGTKRVPALHILEKTLNMKTITVTDEVKSLTSPSGKKREINREETLLAAEKQQYMTEMFREWIWEDEKRRERIERIIEDNFGCIRKRLFDGSFLTFPGMNKAVSFYPYQKNASARIIFTPNTLLAHDVGSGKTYIMAAAGMELRRMKLSEKNLYVVPNNIVGQWKEMFSYLYPDAKILTVAPKDFTPAKRNDVLKCIRDNDFDAVIMAYSCFSLINVSKDSEIAELEAEIRNLYAIKEAKKHPTSRLLKQIEKAEEELKELQSQVRLNNSITFDELSVDRLFVDEAHNFKNIPIDTQITRVLGISNTGSEKCRDMLQKVRIVQKNGGGVIMATGTPITNSITDAFVIQKYLQNSELTLLDLNTFDSWVGMFAEKVTDFEIDVDTNSYRLASRFTRFHNLPELTSLLSNIADFHTADKTNDIPDFDGYTDVVIEKTQELSDYIQVLSERADAVRSSLVSPAEDNLLYITTDGRKAALDIRHVIKDAPFSPNSKAEKCSDNAAFIYHKTENESSTQLIFCDTSTPKAAFNMYHETERLLIEKGVRREHIAFIHDADTEKKREQLFNRMQKGEIRILFGSTFKLGLGVNVQNKLIAIHHLDVPWRPADMKQREGRIIRQGNENKKVYIYRYITKGSFDAYSWQLLETKQRFISSLLSGSLTERSSSDIESTVLDYAEVKALAVGNPLMKERIEIANEISRLSSLQKKAVDDRLKAQQDILEMPSVISRQKELIKNAKADMVFYKKNKKELSKEERRELRETLFGAVSDNLLSHSERELTKYQGFSIILPTNMTKEKPFIYLKRSNSYYVELGDTELGGLKRIDNFLDNMNEHIKKLNDALRQYSEKHTALKEYLSKDESYADEIISLKRKLEKIDKELGVKNNK